MKTSIEFIDALEILDSRGNPTLRAEVRLGDGSVGAASVPSGASTGKFEAAELRDGEKERYGGKGVRKAAENVRGEIFDCLRGMDARRQRELDERMCRLDGTENKRRLGANAILGVSLAAAKAAAVSCDLPLYRYIGGADAHTLPVPMMNILNGGAHADNNVDIQEFMIMPLNARRFADGLESCVKIYRELKKIMQLRGITVGGVGDEGGYAPRLDSDEQALELLTAAIESAGFVPGTDFGIALDAAASEWKTDVGYRMPKRGRELSSAQLLDMWQDFRRRYPIVSIEDGAGEEDWQLWCELTKALGKSTQLVGDDLFVTNAARVRKGMELGAANAVLIKPNQIGTLTETLDAVRLAQHGGYRTIISHRSGETEDSTIADIAVAVGSGQIKTGAPARCDRTAKYNRLLCIEKELRD